MALNLWKPEPKRRSGFVRRPPVVPGVPLSRYTNTELGVRIARRAGQPRQDPGIAWARLMHSANRPKKDVARESVLDLFGLDQFANLKVLTFPASEWLFEQALFARRAEPANRGPRATQIFAMERDIAVFRAACHNIPQGGGNKKRGAIRTPEVPSFASAHVQTAKINSFRCCTFEDYATAETNECFDAAWLDFNGQLSQPRLDAIERFWDRQLRSVLVVTLLELYLSDWMRGRVKNSGGTEGFLASRLLGSEAENVTRYGDGAPMVQIVLRRTHGTPRALVESASSQVVGGEKR